MKYSTREAKFLAVISVILVALQPLLHIRKVNMFLTALNPLASFMSNLDIGTYEQQVEDAETYFRGIDTKTAVPAKQHSATEDVDIVVSIITVRRGKTANGPRYIMPTAANIHSAIERDSVFKKKILLICNTDSVPENHKDAKYLQKYAKYVDQTGENNFGMEHNLNVQRLQRVEPTDRIRRKETEDYVFCLNMTQHFDPKYVLILEDDILPHPDMFRVLKHTVRNYGRYRYKSNRNADCTRREIDHLQLYYIDHLSNVEGYIIGVLKNFSLIVIGGCALVYFATLLCSNPKRNFRFVMFARGMFITCILVLVLKNDFYLEFMRFSPQMYTIMPLPRSSAVAMYYRSEIVPGLINHLLYNVTGSGLDSYKDIAINSYIHSSGLNGYLLKPYLVEHIGLISTRDT